MLIAVEGVSYSGKSTLINELKKYYRSKKTIIIIGKGTTTKIEDKLRELINRFAPELSVEVELFLFAARLKNKTDVIQKLRKRDSLILVDRYDISFSVLFHFVRGLPLKVVKDLKHLAISEVKPDSYIFLDTSENKLRERFVKTRSSHVQREGLKHFKAARTGFRKLYKTIDVRKILLNTTNLSKKECLTAAVSFIEKNSEQCKK